MAVLAVDPSSPFSGGAILGDRVRMQDHATDPAVFIRSMATRGHLGGLALAVPDAVRVLGAAGVPVALVETVGVGQMEVEVASAADTTVVVVTPGWGDSMQANKAGLLEVADLFVINKADRPGAREAQRDLEQMLDLSAPGDWRPPVVADGGDDRRGGRASSGRRWPGTGPTWPRSGALERAAGGPPGPRSSAGCSGPGCWNGSEQVAAGEGFAEAVQAVVDGYDLDPYQAADRLLGLRSRAEPGSPSSGLMADRS